MKTMTWSIAAVAGLLVAALAAVETAQAPSDGAEPAQIVPAGKMSVARAAHQATPLLSGEILVTGGCTGGCDAGLRSSERYAPGTRTFRPAADMGIARDSHAAAALADGRVLVAGGWSQRRATANAELYDPETDRFVAAGTMTVARAAPSSAMLPDGRVLLAGGQSSGLEPLASAEIFDPATSTFSPAGAMSVPRVGHVAVALADGSVLVVGGRSARRGDVLRSAEIFDPATGQFQPTGNLSSPRHKHAAALLPDGRVLVIGGSDERDQRGRHRSSEFYDPGTGRFSPGPDMRRPRFKLPDAIATLPSGAVLVGGGASVPELYEPGTNAFVALSGELDQAPEFATASTLPSGEVLLLGGYDDRIRTSASAWLLRVRQ